MISEKSPNMYTLIKPYKLFRIEPIFYGSFGLASNRFRPTPDVWHLDLQPTTHTGVRSIVLRVEILHDFV